MARFAPDNHIAPGSGGAGVMVRAYRRSPLRWLRRVYWDHRGVRDNDVMLASYPRSGNVWLRFLILELTRGGASFAAIQRGVTYVTWHRAAQSILPDGGRVLKTHEPYRPMYRRAIHLVRDPRDVCLSYFKFLQRTEKITIRPTDDVAASFDHFIDAMIGGRLDAYSTWQHHLLSWVGAAESGKADVLRLRFEDLRADPERGVTRIASWLGFDLPSGRATEVVERCSIEAMRAAEAHAMAHTPEAMPAVSFRTGIANVGDGHVEGWRSRMTAAQVARFEAFEEGLRLMGYPLS